MNNDFATYPIHGLEIRRRGGGGRSLSGRLGLGRKATMRNSGKVRKEKLAKKSMSWSLRAFKQAKEDLDRLTKTGAKQEAVEEAAQLAERRNIHVLSGHDWNKPLGSMLAGSATVYENFDNEDDPFLGFEVDLPEDESIMPSYMQDVVRQVELGLIYSVSPGFMIPPKDVVANAEELEEEKDNPGVYIRVLNQVLLKEISLVTNAVYTESDVTVRAEHHESDYLRKGFRQWL